MSSKVIQARFSYSNHLPTVQINYIGFEMFAFRTTQLFKFVTFLKPSGHQSRSIYLLSDLKAYKNSDRKTSVRLHTFF